MFNITKETLKNNGIEVIVDSVNTLWLNEQHVEEKLGHKKLQSSQTNTTKDTKNADAK